MDDDELDSDEREYDPSLADDTTPVAGLSPNARRKFTWRKGEVEVTPASGGATITPVDDPTIPPPA